MLQTQDFLWVITDYVMWFDRWGPETKQRAYPWKTRSSACPHPEKKGKAHWLKCEWHAHCFLLHWWSCAWCSCSMRKDSKPAHCIVILWRLRKVCSKNDLLGGIVGGCLVAGLFMMTVHLPLCFFLHEYLAKRKSPFTASLLTRLNTVQLALFFQSWRLH